MKTKQDVEFYIQEHLSDLFVLVGMTINKGLPPPIKNVSVEGYNYIDMIKCLHEVEKIALEYDVFRKLPGWEVLNTILDYTHLLD